MRTFQVGRASEKSVLEQGTNTIVNNNDSLIPKDKKASLTSQMASASSGVDRSLGEQMTAPLSACYPEETSEPQR